jgi:catechol 2,3-dioxygenase-like lactoylglutathione lyase family enzyme
MKGGQKIFMKYICPLIVVEDINRSRYLYEEILKQKVKEDHGANIVFEGDFAIHQKEHFQSLIKNYPIKRYANSFELYFEEEHLEEIERTLGEHNFEFIHQIKEQPWKQRVLRFYDYDKNIVEIGEPINLEKKQG